ncbi:MAG: sigma-70 family RNA polymerase sigma factor [Bryobacteraceae bacterium]
MNDDRAYRVISGPADRGAERDQASKKLSAIAPAQTCTHDRSNQSSTRAIPNLAAVSEEELIALCADAGDAGTWEEFLRRFHPLILASVRRVAMRYMCGDLESCNDLAQEVYLKLSADRARLLREFEPRHPGAAFGFVRVVAANVAHDHFKRKGVRHPVEELSVEPVAKDDTEWRVLNRQVEETLRLHATEREIRIFWLYFRYGLSAIEISRLAGISLTVKGVESLLLRLAQRVRSALGIGGKPDAGRRTTIESKPLSYD